MLSRSENPQSWLCVALRREELGRPENRDLKPLVEKIAKAKAAVDAKNASRNQANISWADMIVLAAKASRGGRSGQCRGGRGARRDERDRLRHLDLHPHPHTCPIHRPGRAMVQATTSQEWRRIKIDRATDPDSGAFIADRFGTPITVRLGRVDSAVPAPAGRIPGAGASAQEIKVSPCAYVGVGVGGVCVCGWVGVGGVGVCGWVGVGWGGVGWGGRPLRASCGLSTGGWAGMGMCLAAPSLAGSPFSAAMSPGRRVSAAPRIHSCADHAAFHFPRPSALFQDFFLKLGVEESKGPLKRRPPFWERVSFVLATAAASDPAAAELAFAAADADYAGWKKNYDRSRKTVTRTGERRAEGERGRAVGWLAASQAAESGAWGWSSGVGSGACRWLQRPHHAAARVPCAASQAHPTRLSKPTPQIRLLSFHPLQTTRSTLSTSLTAPPTWAPPLTRTGTTTTR